MYSTHPLPWDRYVIPTPVIDHFLDDFQRNAAFTGFPALGIQWQRMESEALRAACGMATGQKGVLIRTVHPCSHAAGVLLPGDILMRFGGVQVACDGTVPFRSGERIAFSELPFEKLPSPPALFPWRLAPCDLPALRHKQPFPL